MYIPISHSLLFFSLHIYTHIQLLHSLLSMIVAEFDRRVILFLILLFGHVFHLYCHLFHSFTCYIQEKLRLLVACSVLYRFLCLQLLFRLERHTYFSNSELRSFLGYLIISSIFCPPSLPPNKIRGGVSGGVSGGVNGGVSSGVCCGVSSLLTISNTSPSLLDDFQ